MSIASRVTRWGFGKVLNALLGAKVVGVESFFASEDLNGGYVDSSYLQGYRYNPEDGKWYGVSPAPDLGQYAWENPADPAKQDALSLLKKYLDDNNNMEHFGPDDPIFWKRGKMGTEPDCAVPLRACPNVDGGKRCPAERE